MNKSTIIELISILFIILFLYTAISKLMDFPVFKEQIATSPLLAPFAQVIAILLPCSEVLVVLLLAVPRYRLQGLRASMLLMIVFTGYILAILTFNKHIPCSCGGVLEELSWKGHIIFNSIFIVLAAIGAHLKQNTRKVTEKQNQTGIFKNALP